MRKITHSLLFALACTTYAMANRYTVENLYQENPVSKNAGSDLKKPKQFIHQDRINAENKIKTSIVIANTCLQKGERNEALTEIDESLQLAKKYGLHVLEAELLKLISKEYRLSGMSYLGRDYLHSAIAIASKALENDELHYFYGDAYHELAYYSIEKKDFKSAINQLKKGNKSLYKIDDSRMKKHSLASNYQLISDSYLKLRNTDSASHYLKTALNLLKENDQTKKILLENTIHGNPAKTSSIHTEQINEEKYFNDVSKKTGEGAGKRQAGAIDNSAIVTDISKIDKKAKGATVIILIILLSPVVYIFLKKIYTTKKEKKHTNGESSAKKLLNIARDTEQKILEKIKDFEQNYHFTDQNVSLTYLANHFNTNTKYLSTILKKNYDRDYSSYINELRISYISNILEQDKKYRQYKISHLAEISGFSSHSKFASIFKKVKGCSPSEFINNIDEEGLVKI